MGTRIRVGMRAGMRAGVRTRIRPRVRAATAVVAVAGTALGVAGVAACGSSSGGPADSGVPITVPAWSTHIGVTAPPTAGTFTLTFPATTPAGPGGAEPGGDDSGSGDPGSGDAGGYEPGGYDPGRNAAADVAAARTASAKDGRPVLLDFGANWCPDCVVLGRTFAGPGTTQLLAEYHVVRVDVGEFDHNLDLAARYVNLRTSGIPALAVVDSRGRIEVATNQGEFANARSMPAAQVNAFLKKWA